MTERKIVVDIALQTADAANSLKDVKKSLKELKDIQLEFGEGTEEYAKAAVKIGKLKDTLNDANDTARVLTGNVAENLTGAFSRVASAGIGAFQAVEGAQAVFGVENEDLQKQMVKLQGLLNLSAGIKEFANLGQSAKDFKTVLVALVPSLFAQTAATEGAAVAQTGLNAAMRANPIGAIITVLTLLVGAIALFSSSTDDATESQELNTEEIEKAKKSEEDYKKSIDDTNLSLDDRIRKLDDELAVLGKNGVEREIILAQQDADNRKRELLADKNVKEGLAALKRLEDLRALGYLRTTSEFIELKKLESSELVKIGLKAQEDLVKIEELKNGNISEINKQATKESAEESQKTRDERLKNLETLANKRAEIDLNATLQLQKNLDTQNKIQENYFKTVDEVDALYSEISKDRRFKTSEEIYAEINKRLQAEQDAAFKKAELDVSTTEQLKTNNQLQVDIQTEFGKSQQEVDDLYSQIAQEGRLKTSEEIYAEIGKRLQSQKDANKKELEDAEKLRQGKIQAAKSGFTTIANLAELFAGQSKKSQEKAFKVQQAAAIGSAIIDTYQSATAAYKSLAGIPIVGPVLGGIAAAAAVTAGLLNVKKIKEQKFDSGSGGGGGGGSSTPPSLSGGNLPTPSEPTPNQPTPSPQLLGFGDTGQNNLGTPTSTVRAVVLESDITNAQIRVKNYQTESELGG